MTRTDDHYVELGERADQSNTERVDLFISLHYDGSEDPDLRGTTTYYFHESDYPIGRAVNQRLAELETMPNNGVNFGNYQVLRENHQPSILLELGYMTNPADVPQISSQAYYEAVAEKIVAGITDYFQSL